MNRKTLSAFILVMLMSLASIAVQAELVNINKADAKALESTLNGVGPVKAQAIVDYRKKNGPFRDVKDIQNVPGIGDQLYRNNKKNLSTNRGLTRATEKSNSNSALRDGNKTSPVDRNKTQKSERGISGSKDKLNKKDKADKKNKLDKASKDDKKSKNTAKVKKNKDSKKANKDKKSKKDKKSGKNTKAKKADKSKKDKKSKK